MGWIIFGVIALCITLFLWKNTYTEREFEYQPVIKTDYRGYKYTVQERTGNYIYSGKIKMPLWLFIVLITSYIIPIFNTLVFGFFLIVFGINYGNGNLYLHFQNNTIVGKIIKFFNKPVF